MPPSEVVWWIMTGIVYPMQALGYNVLLIHLLILTLCACLLGFFPFLFTYFSLLIYFFTFSLNPVVVRGKNTWVFELFQFILSYRLWKVLKSGGQSTGISTVTVV